MASGSGSTTSSDTVTPRTNSTSMANVRPTSPKAHCRPNAQRAWACSSVLVDGRKGEVGDVMALAGSPMRRHTERGDFESWRSLGARSALQWQSVQETDMQVAHALVGSVGRCSSTPTNVVLDSYDAGNGLQPQLQKKKENIL